MNGNLCHHFQTTAIDTWIKIATSHKIGFTYGEETITESILLNLHQNFQEKIKIWPYDKRKKEPNTGADWEWWIGISGAWFGMRVQAKKISLPSETYGSILTYRTTSKTKNQIQILIEQSKRYSVTPIYCLYTHSSVVPSPVPNCMPSLSRKMVNGCLICHAEVVERIASNKLIDLAPNLVPWHFLVCECASSIAKGNSALQAQNAVRGSLFAETPKGPDDRRLDKSDEFMPFVAPIVSTLPPDLMNFHAASDKRPPFARVDFMSHYAEERGLAGVVILVSGDS